MFADELKGELLAYVEKNLPVVRVLRTDERMGLIRARIFGAKKAKGEVGIILISKLKFLKQCQ